MQEGGVAQSHAIDGAAYGLEVGRAVRRQRVGVGEGGVDRSESCTSPIGAGALPTRRTIEAAAKAALNDELAS
jgi:hypothetical protein